MKATINGITVEGTPQEIAEYQLLQERREAYNLPPTTGAVWWLNYQLNETFK